MARRLRTLVCGRCSSPFKLGYEVISREPCDVIRNVCWLVELASVVHDELLLVLEHISHGRVQQAGCEARHVRDRAVQKELFNDLLARENLTEPDRQTDIVLKRLADNSDKRWDLSANARSESHRQCECNDVLQDLKLILSNDNTRLLEKLQVCLSCSIVVGISLELETSEDLQTLIEELPVKDESSQPESSVLL